jgi:3-oxoacyl-[acyl-carrier-protein] synthase III
MRRCRIESMGMSLPASHFPKWGSLKHATSAGRQCLENSRYNPEDVRVLINTGVHRDQHVCEPAIACYIQRELDINVEFQGRRTLAFDLLNGGCGMLNAAHVVRSLMLSNQIQVGMVVSSEANNDKNPDPEYTYPSSGAALLLDISPRNHTGFGEFVFHSHEEYSGLYTSVVSLKEKNGRIRIKRAAQLEDAYLSTARPLVDELLKKEGLSRDDIDLVVPAQISENFVRSLPETIGVSPDKVCDYTNEISDTLSTSTFLALHRLLESGRASRSKRILLLSFGSGVTVGATIYHLPGDGHALPAGEA